MNKLSLYFLAIAITLLCFSDVHACDCRQETDSVVEDFETANAIFTGTVESISSASLVERRDYFVDNKIRIRLHETFKTDRSGGKYLTVYTGALRGSNCGYPFMRNQSYLIYAYRIQEPRFLYTSSCTKTKPLSQASQSLQDIRKEVERRRILGADPRPVVTAGVSTDGAQRPEFVRADGGSSATQSKDKVYVRYGTDANSARPARGCSRLPASGRGRTIRPTSRNVRRRP